MSQEDDLALIVSKYSQDFDALCLQRHEVGAAEYGQFTFLENNVIGMMMEELADTANYCRMQFIKLMMLQELLVSDLGEKQDQEGNLTIGINTFKGVGEGWSSR